MPFFPFKLIHKYIYNFAFNYFVLLGNVCKQLWGIEEVRGQLREVGSFLLSCGSENQIQLIRLGTKSFTL